MVKLQEEQRIKENLKLRGIRDRASERALRFMNSRERRIGIDKNALDLQVQEKENRKVLEKEMKKGEAAYIEAICDHVEKEEFSLMEQKAFEMESVKQTLLEQIKIPKNNAIKMDGPLIMKRCGAASAQNFDGEDSKFQKRKKCQQKQIQEWSSQQIQELKDRNIHEMEEMRQYSDYVREEDQLRSDLEEEETNAKFEKRKEIDRHNVQKAKEARDKREKDECQEKTEKLEEVINAISDPFLSEETDFSYDTFNKDDCKFRPDHFKGFSKNQIKYIFEENDAVLAEKIKLNNDADNERKDWDHFQATVIGEMEKSEYARQLRVQRDNQIQAETLEIQRAELKKKQAQMKKDKFGAIGEGFFQKFGQSCR